ncbi:MAG: hypothetical protein LAO31_06935 [Acidobacteriia bacterium]|nr:hypothetical protein [Terriglobia bacterium]
MSIQYGFCAVLMLWFLSPLGLRGQGSKPNESTVDLLQQPIQELTLKDQYFMDGIVKLDSLASGLGFSVEYILPSPEAPRPVDPRFTAKITAVTLSEALDWLCRLDPRYTWSRDGTTINVFPRASLEEKNYYFTRKLSNLVFRDERNAYHALPKILKPISSPKEAVITWSGVRDYQTPFNASLTNITVREALNRLIQHLSPTEGWMVTGNQEVMLLVVYDTITLRPPTSNAERP